MVTAGTTIGGRFRVDHLLGSGGMGIVVAATHLELGHRVAIKLLREELTASATVIERFLREARAVVQLRTEHVCRVIDVGRLDDGAPYIVMELLEGSDLGRVVIRQPLPAGVAVDYVMQACVALAEAHAAGIIHRDLKPQNLFVTRRLDGAPLIKVLDFGIAKAMTEATQLTHSHITLGSPGYVSPEQLHSARDVDTRTDIWALGVTLYQLLTARLPFYRTNPTEMAVRIATEPPDPLDVDPGLGAILLRCLEKAPDDRYPDVAALAADLVPFGGPAAPAIAATVHQLARQPTAPRALPAASPSAITAASLAPSARGAASPEPAPAPRAPGVRRRPRWYIAAPLAALVIAGVAAAMVLRRDPGAPAAPTATAMPATAPGKTAAAPGKAATRSSPDAGVSTSGTSSVGTAAAGPRPAPRDATSAETARGRVARPAATSQAEAVRQRQARCRLLTRPAAASRARPADVAVCWCQLKDPARARTAIAKLAAPERQSVRTRCAAEGIKLP